MKRHFWLLSLMGAALILCTSTVLACDPPDMTLTKGDYLTKSKPLRVSKNETKKLSVRAYNPSTLYNLGVKVVSSTGKVVVDLQIMPGKSLSFEEHLYEPARYFVLMYNPYSDHMGAEGDAWVNAKTESH